MALKKVNVSLPPAVVKVIDGEFAERMGGRSEAIRTIVMMYLLKEGFLHGKPGREV